MGGEWGIEFLLLCCWGWGKWVVDEVRERKKLVFYFQCCFSRLIIG